MVILCLYSTVQCVCVYGCLCEVGYVLSLVVGYGSTHKELLNQLVI